MKRARDNSLGEGVYYRDDAYSEHQSLRDCYAGTYVVRCDAEPVGKAQVHLAYYNAFGFSLMYPRVVRPKPQVDAINANV